MSLFNSTLTSAAQSILAAPVAPLPAPSQLGLDPAASRLLDPGHEVYVQGMLRPFQPHQAAAYLYLTESIRRFGWAIPGYDMGLGKTQIFLALIADAIRDGGHAILIGPPVGKGGYQSDIRAAFPGLRFAHLHGRKPERDASGAPIVPDADVYFLSDDALTLNAWLVAKAPTAKGELPTLTAFATSAKVFVRDEIQRDKGNQGKHTARAKVSHALGNAMRLNGGTVIGATGTLTTNRPLDAFLPLQIIGGDRLVLNVTPGARSLAGFLFRYCGPEKVDAGRQGIKTTFVGQTNVLDLHEHLRRNGYGRVERKQVRGLPNGGWLLVPIALNGAMARYDALNRDFLSTVLNEKGPEAMWRAASAEALTRMMALWSEAGAAKAKAAVEYVLNLTEQGRKVIVFYEHTEGAYHGLKQGFEDAKVPFAEINGHTTGNKRLAGIESFQTGTTMVMLAQVQAAGMAVTLTAAADAVYVQLPWSCGDLAQSAGRNLRTDDISRARHAAGESVTWHVLVARHEDGSPTIDDHMWSVLNDKAQVIDAINAGAPITIPDANVHHAILQRWFDSQAAA